jgi:hypothetical protein
MIRPLPKRTSASLPRHPAVAYLFRFAKKTFRLATFALFGTLALVPIRDWEIIADKLSNAGWSLGWVSAVDSEGRTLWVVDAHRYDRKREQPGLATGQADLLDSRTMKKSPTPPTGTDPCRVMAGGDTIISKRGLVATMHITVLP